MTFLFKKHKESCPHNCHYDDLTVQYGTDKQAHENVLKQIHKKNVPDFIDSEDTMLQLLGWRIWSRNFKNEALKAETLQDYFVHIIYTLKYVFFEEMNFSK